MYVTLPNPLVLRGMNVDVSDVCGKIRAVGTACCSLISHYCIYKHVSYTDEME